VIHAADVGSGEVHAWHALSWHSASAAGMKTHGEIEAAVCEGFARFVQDFMGRGPKEIRAHLVVDLVVVRLRGILSAAEISLAAVLPPEKGRDMLKNVARICWNRPWTNCGSSSRPRAAVAAPACITMSAPS